ncbi:YbaB/EbfC family nucleoid-associated protein [Dactylosporangium sp. NPDC005555]|uniref:YbaB/EbfC family nucleoid-associated protein n=1 Tax=Dactylosporangium sp. NPDC005555 TaxID=3154889 RepID=UPI0033A5AEED
MSTSWHEEIERAYAELDESQQAIAQVQHDMTGKQITVTSKNRAITVVTDAQGEVIDIKFNSRAYRSMPAAELSALLVETIGEARRQSLAELASMFSAVLPQSTPILDMLNGTVDMDEMLREAMRQIPDLPGTPGAERS